MKIGFLDCFSGVSGNMLLGVLLDCGLPHQVLQDAVTGLNLQGDQDTVQLEISRPLISGLQVCLVRVHTEKTGHHRHLADIETILQRSALPKTVISRSCAVFRRLAEAEAKVHGTSPEKIHFHEVGATDAIVDIVGVVAGIEYLGLERITCSPLPMPKGWVHCGHGLLPLPAPAVCELLRGIPVYGSELKQELVTPTGAALIAELCSSFGIMEPMILDTTGYGAGTMQRTDGRPNLLRLMIGQSQTVQEAQQVEVIETNLDDWNPELWPYLSDKLMEGGALDVSLVPIQMKKGRPGFLLRVIGDPVQAINLRQLILNETSSIGLRFHTMQRQTLPRRPVSIETPWGTVLGKEVQTMTGTRVTPEYEDCLRVAEKNKIPLQQVYQTIQHSLQAEADSTDGAENIQGVP